MPAAPEDAAIRVARMACDMIEFVEGRTFYPGGKAYQVKIR